MIMKTITGQPIKTRFLFIQLLSRAKTDVWAVYNKKTPELLGDVRWYDPWRQYCFYPRKEYHFYTNEAVLNADCLARIIDLLAALENDRRTDHSSDVKHEAH